VDRPESSTDIEDMLSGTKIRDYIEFGKLTSPAE
jgi:hypothetical protein